MSRANTRVVKIGDRVIGGGNPILIQSMTNTKTEDVEATVKQIQALTEAGCDIIRCAVPTMEAAKALSEIKKQISIPLVADIHFDYKMAIAAMENGADTRTSQVNAEEYEQYFETILKEGKDIIHLTLSSGISGSVNSAMVVKQNLEEKYPDRKLYIVDSLGASSGYGLIMDTLADMRDAGKNIDELHEWAEANKLRMHHWFFSTDLTFYIKGGRVTKTAGFIGGLLNICPLLNMDNLGRLIVSNLSA